MTQQRQLKAEILTTKAELQRTSAQEQFARWAKLRRKVDKGLEDLDKLSAWWFLIIWDTVLMRACADKQLVTTKASFAAAFRPVLWILTSGIQLFIGWWYGRQAVFYVPASVLGPLTWWLSFPFAPAGSYQRLRTFTKRVSKASFNRRCQLYGLAICMSASHQNCRTSHSRCSSRCARLRILVALQMLTRTITARHNARPTPVVTEEQAEPKKDQ